MFKLENREIWDRKSCKFSKNCSKFTAIQKISKANEKISDFPSISFKI